ncbi:MAG: hydroxyethylthiazole kinase [Bacteroidota bacterium]
MDASSLFSIIEQVRTASPLVHNITNYVVMNNTANALLAAGASPVMAHAEEEVADMVGIASSLVINIGTLSPHWVRSMELAMTTAKNLGKPVVLDPVGAGATPYRNEVLAQLLAAAAPTVIRGNGSEIGATQNQAQKTKGVDSTAASHTAISAAQSLNQLLGSVVCISGEVDYVIQGDRVGEIHNGSAMMAKVTGMGCTATSLIGACLGVHEDAFEATMAAMSLIGVAGELAAKKAAGPGSLQLHLLDTLYTLSKEEFTATVRTTIQA